MIRTGFASWRAVNAAGSDRFVLQLSRWSRGTLIVLLVIGIFQMLVSGLYALSLLKFGYQLLGYGGVFVSSESRCGDISSAWAILLLLLFSGDFMRVAAWRELHRRRRGVVENTRDQMRTSWASVIVGMLLAPVLLFWGIIGVVSFVRSWQIIVSRPWFRPTWTAPLQGLDVWSVSIWWLLTLAWLAGGVALIWRGIYAFGRRSVLSS